jgi:hypothetical protein
MRVIRRTTGSIGRTTLRWVIDHPDLELVGLFVTNPTKVGLDAGDIGKKGKTGIIATNKIDDILGAHSAPLLAAAMKRGGHNC